MNPPHNKLPQKSSHSEIDAFLTKVRKTTVMVSNQKRGRLLFALDATASREPVWDHACHIQGQMFDATASLGGLDVQLAYYRGFMEFDAIPWSNSGPNLLSHMTSIRCAAGQTQIAKVIQHGIMETHKAPIQALIFVGDAMEEDPDALNRLAGTLGILGVPIMMFQDGFDRIAERAFREIAQLSNGAYCQFDAGSAERLRDLLCAVAIFAAGGQKALQVFSKTRDPVVAKLTAQLTKARR
jgi:hypothetical protein